MNRVSIFLTAFFSLLTFSVFCQDAIVELSKTQLEIKGPGAATIKIYKRIEIKNKSGKTQGIIRLHEDDFRKSHLNFATIHKNGKKIKSVFNNQLEEISLWDGFSIATDNRLRYFIPDTEPPYTISYEYTIKLKGFLFLPSWTPIEEFDTPVKESSYSISAPTDFKFNIHEQNIDKPYQTVNKGIQTTTWKISDHPGIPDVEFMPPIKSLVPFVECIPAQFEMGDYEGQMDTWENFGKWYLQMLDERQTLPIAEANHIKALTKDLSSNREKVKKIYEYMQQKTRYVSIQLGIGGWQPFSAEFVSEKGYGDCKALVNYMQTLLKSVEISSMPALVKAGKNDYPVRKESPSSGFNHVILCVPSEQDTIWLECTSQLQPFDYLGAFTADRNVLLISAEGGKMARTPKYENELIATNRHLFVKHSDSDLNPVVFKESNKGIKADKWQSISRENLQKKKDYLHEKLQLADFQLDSFSIDYISSSIPQANVKVYCQARGVTQQSDSSYSINLKTLGAMNYVPPRSEDRSVPIYIRKDQLINESIVLEFPHAIKKEFVPDDKLWENDFGTYTCKFSIRGNELFIERQLKMHKGSYSPESYEKLRKFYKSISRLEKQQIAVRIAS